jgi:urease accessory protein
VARLTRLEGSLAARFSPAGGGAVRAQVSARSPLELRGPFPRGGLPEYWLRNATAGALDGDSYRVDVTAKTGAAVSVAAGSAGKVYAGSASLDVRLQVEPASLLVWGPHLTIVQAGAAYRQSTLVTVAENGQAILAEVLALGRLARGERFEFESLESELDVIGSGGALLFSEAYVLRPHADLAASMAGCGVLVSVYALGLPAALATHGLEAAFGAACTPAGWSRLPNGAGWAGRALAETLSQGAELAEIAVTRLLGGVRSEAPASGPVGATAAPPFRGVIE